MVDELSRRLSEWTLLADAAARELGRRLGLAPADIDIQGGLLAVMQLDNATELLETDWTLDRILELLGGIDFPAWIDVEEVEMQPSILPQGTPRRLDEEIVKAAGEIWVIHKYDPDPFPFLPHAHNRQSGLKLDLRNGRLYRKRMPAGQVRRKDLQRIRDAVRRTPLPELSE